MKLLGLVVSAYVVLVAFLWGAQERLVLPGAGRSLPDPSAVGFENGQRVTVSSHDGLQLHGWYLPPEPGSAAPAAGLLWFYGNMETVGTLADVLSYLKPKPFGLLVLDYRGYGENHGHATEVEIERDGEAAWSYLKSRPGIDSTRIAAYGRSIGSTVATHLASIYPVSAVVLDSPMSTARDVAAEHYWFLPRFLVRMKLDNKARAADIEVPLLVIHGLRDRIIPAWMGREVAGAARNGRFVGIEGAGHNSTYSSAPVRYRELLWEHLGVESTDFNPAGDSLQP